MVHARVARAKSKCLRSAEALARVLEAAKFAFASALVSLIRHFHVVLGIATATVLGVKAAVSSFKNIHVRVCESRVVLGVDSPVLGADMASHHGGAVRRVFAVEDEDCSSLHGVLDQLGGEEVLAVVVDSSVNVSSLVLVLETAVNDHFLVELVTVLSVQEINHGGLCYPGNGVRGVIGEEVRQDGLLDIIGVHAGNRLWGGRRGVAAF